MVRKLSILGVALAALVLAGAVGAEAGDRYHFFDAGFSVGGVDIAIGYDSHRGGTLFLRTAHDFYDHPRFRCRSSCRRVDRYVHHGYGCPRLSHFLGRHGYHPLDLIPPHIAHRYLGSRYDDNYYDHYRYHDRYYGRRHRGDDDDDDGYGRRRYYADDDDDDDDDGHRRRHGYRWKHGRRHHHDDDD